MDVTYPIRWRPPFGEKLKHRLSKDSAEYKRVAALAVSSQHRPKTGGRAYVKGRRGATGVEELLVLEDRGEPLAGGDRDVALGLPFGHERRAVRQHGIFVEKRVQGFQSSTERYRFSRVHLPVDLYTDVYVWADRVSYRRDSFHGLVGPF